MSNLCPIVFLSASNQMNSNDSMPRRKKNQNTRKVVTHTLKPYTCLAHKQQLHESTVVVSNPLVTKHTQLPQTGTFLLTPWPCPITCYMLHVKSTFIKPAQPVHPSRSPCGRLCLYLHLLSIVRDVDDHPAQFQVLSCFLEARNDLRAPSSLRWPSFPDTLTRLAQSGCHCMG